MKKFAKILKVDYGMIAKAVGKTRAAVSKDAQRGKFSLQDFRSVIKYVNANGVDVGAPGSMSNK